MRAFTNRTLLPIRCGQMLFSWFPRDQHSSHTFILAILANFSHDTVAFRFFFFFFQIIVAVANIFIRTCWVHGEFRWRHWRQSPSKVTTPLRSPNCQTWPNHAWQTAVQSPNCVIFSRECRCADVCGDDTLVRLGDMRVGNTCRCVQWIEALMAFSRFVFFDKLEYSNVYFEGIANLLNT